jgi:hypothetical protein
MAAAEGGGEYWVVGRSVAGTARQADGQRQLADRHRQALDRHAPSSESEAFRLRGAGLAATGEGVEQLGRQGCRTAARSLAHCSHGASGLAAVCTASLEVQFLGMQGRTDGITGNWLFHTAPVDRASILADENRHIIRPDRGRGRK